MFGWDSFVNSGIQSFIFSYSFLDPQSYYTLIFMKLSRLKFNPLNRWT